MRSLTPARMRSLTIAATTLLLGALLAGCGEGSDRNAGAPRPETATTTGSNGGAQPPVGSAQRPVVPGGPDETSRPPEPNGRTPEPDDGPPETADTTRTTDDLPTENVQPAPPPRTPRASPPAAQPAASPFALGPTVSCLRRRGAKVTRVPASDATLRSLRDLAQRTSRQVTRQGETAWFALSGNVAGAELLLELLTQPEQRYALAREGNAVVVRPTGSPRALSRVVVACLRR